MSLFCKKPSPVAQAIIDSLLKYPEKWMASEYRLFVGSEDSYLAPIRIWVSNGINYLKIESPGTVRLQTHDKKHVWKAFRNWQQNTKQFLEILKKAEEA